MRKLSAFFCLLITLISVNAQDFDWAFDLRINNDFYGTWEHNLFSADPAGNFIVAGIFLDTVDFDPDTANTKFMHSGPCHDIFIARYTKDGAYSWSYKIDVNSIQTFNNLSVLKIDFDGGGNVYIAGVLRGSAIFHGQNSVDTAVGHKSHYDAFIAKYSANGQFLWFKRMGGDVYQTSLEGFDVSPNGDIFISGTFTERLYFNYPSKARSTSLYSELKNGVENFMARLDLNGNFQWAHMLTGKGISSYMELAIDDQKNVFFLGIVEDSIFLDTITNFITVSKTNRDIVILKMDGNGNLLKHRNIWSTSLQKSFYDYDVSPSGDLVLLGNIGAGTLHLDSSNTISTTLTSDNFIVRYDNDLDCEFAFTMNTVNTYVNANSICISADGNTQLAGWFRGKVDFDPTIDTFFVQSKYAYGQAYIAVYDTGFSTNNVLTFDHSINGSWPNFQTLDSDDDNNIYTYGYVGDSCDMDPSEDTFLLNGLWYPRVTVGCLYNPTPYGHSSTFIAKYKYCQPPGVQIGPGPDHACFDTDVSLYVGVSGDNPISYQWYKDNSPIPNSNGGYLQLYNLQYADSGNYICVVTNDCGIDVSDTLEFKVLDCTGIGENDDAHILLLPNPTEGDVILRLENMLINKGAEIKITDIRGHLVYRNAITTNKLELKLDRNLGSGLYLVEVVNGNDRYISKLIIE